MMTEIRYTLLSDGSSDRALLPILTWLLREHCKEVAIQEEWADLRRLRQIPKTLAGRIQMALELYPCDLLFVHRDAEKQSPAMRFDEIKQALEEARRAVTIPPSVSVVPVRMQEAWLLFDETALRQAVGNSSGSVRLSLPAISRLEQLPDAKKILYELLRQASECSGRRLEQLSVNFCAQRVPEFVPSFAPLRRLSAFRQLEADLQNIISKMGSLL